MPDSLPHRQPPSEPIMGTLYSFRRCPYAMRARLACTVCLPKLSLELREVVLKNKPPELLAISPKATVPVLLLSGEQRTNNPVIDESRDIMLWALQHTSDNFQSQYLPIHLQLDIDALIDENDGSFKWALDRYKYADRYEEGEQYYREKGEIFLAKLEKLLEQNKYLFTVEPSLADIAIFPFVRQFAHVDKQWFEQSPYPKLIEWLNAWLESDLFLSIMDKNKPWQAGHEITYFPR